MIVSTMVRSSSGPEKNISARPSANIGSAMFSPPIVLKARTYRTVDGRSERLLTTSSPIRFVASMTSLPASTAACSEVRSATDEPGMARITICTSGRASPMGDTFAAVPTSARPSGCRDP